MIVPIAIAFVDNVYVHNAVITQILGVRKFALQIKECFSPKVKKVIYYIHSGRTI